jgi:hypothetical protein
VWTGGWDPSIHRRWLLAFHLEMEALRPPVVIFAERAGSWLGAGLSPGLSPLSILCRIVPPVHYGRCKPQSGGGSNEVLSLILLSVSNVPVITWLVVLVDPMTFLLKPQTEFSTNI